MIHVTCHRHRLAASPERLSCHWFDLACLARHDAGRALLEDVVRHRTNIFHASDASDGDCLSGLAAARSRRRSAWSDDDAMRRAGIVGTRHRSQVTVIRTASVTRPPPDVRQVRRYGPDSPCARLRRPIGLDPGLMVGKGEVRRPCGAPRCCAAGRGARPDTIDAAQTGLRC